MSPKIFTLRKPAIPIRSSSGAFAKPLRKVTLSTVMSVLPSVFMKQHDSHQMDFREISYLGFLLTFDMFWFLVKIRHALCMLDT